MKAPATHKQLMALYLSTGKKFELRNMGLSCEDAKILIQKNRNGENIDSLLLEYGAEMKEERVPRTKKSEPLFTPEELIAFDDMIAFVSLPENNESFLAYVREQNHEYRISSKIMRDKIESNCERELEASPF